ncbi:MAG: methionyl-tRNA formyltransferase [Bacteroidales bacterium]|nr:methionyl-tRNA formyltransferase [Bacteroidales bacterium]MCM1416299.1 methionyl-tRNA formyltransferase [bacterium]MCM1424341.1 methionyl-tRNA formyltransferase [bacterium]
MKLVFMGTPDFAVGALEALIEAGHQIAAVVTQPDKPKGRGKEVQMTPVKACAVSHGIPVFQPVKIREPEAVETLRSYQADIFVVAAFGQILSEEILAMPQYGCVNIHASLLPRYRGAGPIQWAIINGEKITGVTIMQMDKGLDTGDMLFRTEVEIAPDETADTLHDKLSAAGARLIVEALAKIEAGDVTPVKQNDEDSCYAKMLNKSMGKIDWRMEAEKLDCLIRGLISWPGASTLFRGKTLKIWQEEPVLEQDMAAWEAAQGQEQGGFAKDAPPGTVVRVEKDAFYVQTGKGVLKVLEVQPEGKKRMAVKDFLLGYPIKAGEMFEKN